jgi:phage-related holin
MLNVMEKLESITIVTGEGILRKFNFKNGYEHFFDVILYLILKNASQIFDTFINNRKNFTRKKIFISLLKSL